MRTNPHSKIFVISFATIIFGIAAPLLSFDDNCQRRLFPVGLSKLETGAQPIGLVIDDFNNDGFLDLVTRNFFSEISIILATGDGTYLEPQHLAVPDTPVGIATADLNDDGWADIVTVNVGNTFSVFLNPGGGNFGSAESYPPLPGTNGASSIALADFNGDNSVDIATTHVFTDNVSVVLGNGDGTFNLRQSQLMSNPGFESLFSINNWVQFAGGGASPPTRVNTAPKSGSWHLSAEINGTNNSFSGIQQSELNIIPGEEYTFSLFARRSGNLGIQAEFRIEWLDHQGNFVGGQFDNNVEFSGSLSEDYVLFSQTDTAPAGATELRAVFAVQSFGSGDNFGTVFVDDATVQGPIPDNLLYAAGDRPESIVVADFNFDDTNDLATVNSTSDDISVLLGLGDGTFSTAQSYTVGDKPVSIATADFDDDGSNDLAVALENAEGVSVVLGFGDGTFGASQYYPTPFNNDAISISTGDFNGDGFIDLATANDSISGNDGLESVSVLVGNGDGTFTPAVRLESGYEPTAVLSADLNNDGFSDLACTNNNGDDVWIWDGGEAGLVVSKFPVGDRPQAITMGDFNNDGFFDLATANVGLNNISILVGLGDGIFSTGSDYFLGTTPEAIATDDFNGDGVLDLATANSFNDEIAILLGIGDGMFGAPQNLATGDNPRSILAADINQDGVSDILTANLTSQGVSIHIGIGDGTFASPQHFAAGGGLNDVNTGDFNGDGITDLVAASQGELSILLGLGDGAFSEYQAFTAGNSAFSVAVGDFNGDGNSDLVTANINESQVSVLYGVGDGTFGNAQTFAVGDGPQLVIADDFNNDGFLDLATANETSGDISVLAGLGNGNFESPLYFAAGREPAWMVAGDLNGDGSIDIATANFAPGSENVSVLLNQCLRATILLGDVNLDGSVDLLDVAPFVALLSSGEFQAEADCNQDGAVNLLDVDPFIAILGG